jgi:hypothetical protein
MPEQWMGRHRQKAAGEADSIVIIIIIIITTIIIGVIIIIKGV